MYFKIFRKTMSEDSFLFQEGLNDFHKPPLRDPRFQNYGYSNGFTIYDEKQIEKYLDLRADLICPVFVPDGEIEYKLQDETRAEKIILSKERPLWRVDTFEWLESLGVNLFDKANSNILCGAVANGNLELTKWLLKRGACATADHSKALCWAVEYGDLDMIRCLIHHGADTRDVDEMELDLAEEKGHCASFLVHFMKECQKQKEAAYAF